MLAFMIIAVVVVGIIIYRRGGLRLPAVAGLSRGVMASSKARNGTIIAVAIIVIIGAVLYFVGSTEIIQLGKTNWMWIVGGLVLLYMVWNERGILRVIVGTALVVGIIVAAIVGTYSQVTSGSPIPTGCSSEPILVQPPIHSFELEQGCVVTLDLSLLVQKEFIRTKNPNATINPQVDRDAASNPIQILEADAELITTALERPRYVGNRLLWRIKANDNLEQYGVTTVKLKAYSLETAR